jgi:RNA polymerase sigma-70 factor (ECF subfamily)
MELIRRWQSGDERAATVLVERHSRALARFASSSGAADDAEDLVQDTFIRAFGALDGFRGDSSFRTWLFTIERRLIVDRARSGVRRGTTSEVREDHAVTSHDALDALIADETGARLQAAMRRLTPMQRQVFTLRVAEGTSYRDIAGIVGTTEGAARVHYHNALVAVKEYLDD